MADADWVENLKRIALNAVDAGDPCDIILGTVTGAGPLSVQLDQKTTVTGSQLLVPRHLTDREVVMSIPEIGTVPVTVQDGLKAGDKVLLIQKRGAQQYLVIGKW